MKQVNIKSERVAELLEQVIAQTGETKVDAVANALESRLLSLRADANAQRTLDWLKTMVWSKLDTEDKGRAPSKEEQEELLGF